MIFHKIVIIIIMILEWFNLFYFILVVLFYSIWIYFIWFYFILFYSILFYFIYHVLVHFILIILINFMIIIIMWMEWLFPLGDFYLMKEKLMYEILWRYFCMFYWYLYMVYINNKKVGRVWWCFCLIDVFDFICGVWWGVLFCFVLFCFVLFCLFYFVTKTGIYNRSPLMK